jgi:hypothetical protein
MGPSALTWRGVLVTASATFFAAALSGCTVLGTIAPAPLTVNGNSQLTADGITAIKTTQAATFDFTARPLKMASLGFPEESEGTIVVATEAKPISVSMKTQAGEIEMDADAFRVRRGADGIVDRIDLSVSGSDIEGTIRELKRAGDDLGFNLAKGKDPEADTGEGQSSVHSWRPGYGNKAGTVFSVEIFTSADTGGSTFIYSAHLADEFYTADSTARITATGKL